MLAAIADVPERVRKGVLMEFARACQQLHKIAFYQWRRRFSKLKDKNDYMLVNNIEKQMSYIYHNVKLDKQPVNYPFK